MRCPAKLALLGCVSLSWACATGSAPAGLAKWDQARVTGIARQLVTASDAWYMAVREEPGGPVGLGGTPGEFNLAQGAQLLQEHSRELADHLAEGKGFDETRNFYRTIKEIADSTEDAAQRSPLDDPTEAAWAKVADLLRQIAPYYDPKALTP